MKLPDLPKNLNSKASAALGNAKSWLKNAFQKPEELKNVNKLFLAFSTLFGCGYFKYGSGTLASAVTTLAALLIVNISQTLFFGLTISIIIVGFIVTERTLVDVKNPDPSYIVIDEVVGQLIPFIIICGQGSSFKSSFILALLAFIIFRILDIYKPGFIGKSEKLFHGTTAVMIDDILAGACTLVAIFFISIIV